MGKTSFPHRFLGKVKRDVLDRFDIKTEVLLCELSIRRIIPLVKLEKRFHQMPRFPSTKRDISFIVGKEVSHQRIVSLIKEAGGDLVKDIELFDQYSGAQIPEGEKGLAYSVEYQSEGRTLTDEEVNRLHAKVCDELVRQVGVRIR